MWLFGPYDKRTKHNEHFQFVSSVLRSPQSLPGKCSQDYVSKLTKFLSILFGGYFKKLLLS